MSEPSKTPIPYPLQFGALEDFCHPAESHIFAAPAYYAGQALVANGYIALRIDRGLWSESDFSEPPAGFLTRFLALPWRDLSAAPAVEWRAMDDVRGMLYKFGPRATWLGNRPSPSPVCRVGGEFLARLSHLQLIARLPRCEVILPGRDATAMTFRFTGGQGLLAADKRLKESSFSIFSPRHCPVDGGSIPRSTGPCILPPKVPYWKSFEPTE